MPQAVFDVIGTCFCYDVMVDAIETSIGDKLRLNYCKPELFFHAWMTACERDFSYLSLCHEYRPNKVVLKSLFFKTLHHAGIKEPSDIATEEELDYLCDQWLKLKARPGLKECWKALRDNGFDIWCLTDGDHDSVKGYFENSGLDISDDFIVSCDTIRAGKPEPEVYQYMLDLLPNKGTDAWFVAVHSWDCLAAKKSGFKTAWSDVYERYACEDIFGRPDIEAGDLIDLADQIVAAERCV